jgi:hypothetical protein
MRVAIVLELFFDLISRLEIAVDRAEARLLGFSEGDLAKEVLCGRAFIKYEVR